MISDKPIQSKPLLMSDATYQAIIDKVDRDLFYSAEESKQNEQKYHSHAHVPKHAIYIRNLEAAPEELDNIKTLEQFLAVLGYWIEDLKHDQRKGAIRLKQFFKALEAHHDHLNIKSETLNHYYLDAVLLLACRPPYKNTRVPKDAKDIKGQIVAQAVRTMGSYFADEKIMIDFLRDCPHAAANLLPETLEKLCEKHLSIARVVLTTSSLAKKTNKIHVAKKLFSHDTNKLVEFISGLSDPAAFLVEQRDWITGDHLLAIVPLLLAKIPDKFSKDYLSDYLYSKKDPQSKKPIQKLQEKITALNKTHCPLNIQEDITAMLNDNQLRGWLNLPGDTLLKIAQFWEEASPIVCQSRDLYAKTKDFDRHYLSCHQVRSSYLKAYFDLEKAIERTSGGFWGRDSIRLDNYFAGLKRQRRIDDETALVIVRNERYWKRMVPAPAKKGLIWGWWRSPDQVAREQIDIGSLSPIFARALAIKGAFKPVVPSRASSTVNAAINRRSGSTSPTVPSGDEKEYKSDMKSDSPSHQPTITSGNASRKRNSPLVEFPDESQTQLIVSRPNMHKKASDSNSNDDTKPDFAQEQRDAYCFGYAAAWFEIRNTQHLTAADMSLERVKDLITLAEHNIADTDQKFYEQSRRKMLHYLTVDQRQWETMIINFIGTLDTNPIVIHKELLNRIQLMQQYILNAYETKKYSNPDQRIQHALALGKKDGYMMREFAYVYMSERNYYEDCAKIGAGINDLRDFWRNYSKEVRSWPKQFKADLEEAALKIKAQIKESHDQINVERSKVSAQIDSLYANMVSFMSILTEYTQKRSIQSSVDRLGLFTNMHKKKLKYEETTPVLPLSVKKLSKSL